MTPLRVVVHNIHQMRYNGFPLALFPHQHCYIPRTVTGCELTRNLVGHKLQLAGSPPVLFIIGGGSVIRGKKNLHIPLETGMLRGDLLHKPGISACNCLHSRIPVKQSGHGIENRVVEPHHIGRAAPVAVFSDIVPVHRHRIRETPPHQPLHTVPQQFRVGVSESVDALFLITDNQIVVATAQAFKNKRFKVFPLHLRRVLELVDKVMAYGGAHPLVDKRGLILVDDAAQKVVGVRKQERVGLAPVFVKITVHLAEKPQLEHAAVEVGKQLRTPDIFQSALQSLLHNPA